MHKVSLLLECIKTEMDKNSIYVYFLLTHFGCIFLYKIKHLEKTKGMQKMSYFHTICMLQLVIYGKLCRLI